MPGRLVSAFKAVVSGDESVRTMWLNPRAARLVLPRLPHPHHASAASVRRLRGYLVRVARSLHAVGVGACSVGPVRRVWSPGPHVPWVTSPLRRSQAHPTTGGLSARA